MSIQFQVQATAKPGLKGRHRAGRFFSNVESSLVEVLEQDEDPPCAQITAQPFVLGRKSWAAILEDKQLRIIPAGDTLKLEPMELQRQRQQFDASWSALKETHAHELGQAVADKGAAEAHAQQLEKELIEAMDKIQVLAADLAQARTLIEGAGKEDETPTEVPHARGAKEEKPAKGSKGR